MTIGVFSECYEPILNGVVVSINTFAAELERRGHRVVIFAPAYPGHQDTGPRTVYRFPSFRFFTNREYPVAFPFPRLPVAEKLGLDLVHVQHLFTMGRLGVRVGRRLGVPVVYTFHTLLTEYTHYVPFFQGILKRAIVRTIRRFCNRVDHVIAPTGIIRDLLRDYGVDTPITPIPTGIALPPPRRSGREWLRQELGVPEELPILVFAGRLAPEKKVDFLIRAFRQVLQKVDAALIFLGGGPWTEQMRALAEEQGVSSRVFLLGYRPREQMADYYSASDLFVFPSTTETQGVVLVEAMACGLPAVAVRAFGPADVMEDGKEGFLVPFDEEAFAERCVELVADPGLRATMATAARTRAQDFSPERTADRLLEVYDSLLSPGKR